MKAKIGHTEGFSNHHDAYAGWGGRPRATVTFQERLTEDEREHARLLAITSFITLIWIADKMNELDCSFSDAARIVLTKPKK